MKRRLISLLLAFFFLPLLFFSVAAEEAELIPQIEDFAGTEAILDAVSEEDAATADRLLADPSASTLLSLLWDALLPGLREALPLFYRLLAMILLAALFRAGAASFGGKTVEVAMDLILALAFLLGTYPFLEEGLALSQRSLSTLSSLMIAGLPAMATLRAMAGQVNSASLQATSLSFFVTGAGAIQTSLIFPAVKALYALFCAGSVGELSCAPLVRFGTKTVKRAVILGFTLVGALLGLRNALALAQDTLAMRSIRFAAGNFIPVVGSLVGENTRALTAALGAVKTQCGVVVIVLLLLLTLPCLLGLWCRKIFLSLGGAAACLMGEEKLARLMEQLGELFDLLLALTTAQSVFFIFYVALFLKGGGTA